MILYLYYIVTTNTANNSLCCKSYNAHSLYIIIYLHSLGIPILYYNMIMSNIAALAVQNTLFKVEIRSPSIESITINLT